MESSYNNFVRDLGSDGQRLDIRPRLSYPVTPGGFSRSRRRVGFRETVYDTRVVGAKVEDGFLVEDTEKDVVNRALFEGGLDLEARAFRVFELDGALGIQKIQHAIEPRVSYNYVSDVRPGRPPPVRQHRPGRGQQQRSAYSLTNRIKARSPATELYPAGRVWELARLTFEPELGDRGASGAHAAGADQRPLRDAGAAAAGHSGPRSQPARPTSSATCIFEPVLRPVLPQAPTSFDPYEVDVRSATMDLVYQTTDLFVGVGSRHGLSGEPQFRPGRAARPALAPVGGALRARTTTW